VHFAPVPGCPYFAFDQAAHLYDTPQPALFSSYSNASRRANLWHICVWGLFNKGIGQNHALSVEKSVNSIRLDIINKPFRFSVEFVNFMAKEGPEELRTRLCIFNLQRKKRKKTGNMNFQHLVTDFCSLLMF
jgi:hypothetical protein